MQLRARAGDGQPPGSHPALVDLKNADDRTRHGPGREAEPAQVGGGWLNNLLGRSKAGDGNRPAAENPLLAFTSEGSGVHPSADPAARLSPVSPARAKKGSSGTLWFFGALVLLGGLGALGANRLELITIPGLAAKDGHLTVETQPPGAEVTIDGQPRGVTPLTLAIKPGAHTLTVKSGEDERVVPLTVAAGAELGHSFEMKTPEPVVVSGRMSVVTDPAGARVSVDGKPVGTSPIAALELPVAAHRVTVTSETGSVERTVTIEAGTTTSVVFSLPKVLAPLGGWLSLSAPFDVQIVEGGEVIGSGGAAKIMLAGGRHDLVLVNRTLDFQETRRVEIAPGKITPIRVDPPRAMLSANARPWADVLVDGVSVGQTPIANLPVQIGTHQIVFRHPQLGERRETVIVNTKGPNRIAVDLTRNPSSN